MQPCFDCNFNPVSSNAVSFQTVWHIVKHVISAHRWEHKMSVCGAAKNLYIYDHHTKICILSGSHLANATRSPVIPFSSGAECDCDKHHDCQIVQNNSVQCTGMVNVAYNTIQRGISLQYLQFKTMVV